MNIKVKLKRNDCRLLVGAILSKYAVKNEEETKVPEVILGYLEPTALLTVDYIIPINKTSRYLLLIRGTTPGIPDELVYVMIYYEGLSYIDLVNKYNVFNNIYFGILTAAEKIFINNKYGKVYKQENFDDFLFEENILSRSGENESLGSMFKELSDYIINKNLIDFSILKSTEERKTKW
jgi:hypothetical protein